MLRVVIAGEGTCEVGHRVEGRLGVVEALLRRIAPAGWEVVDTILWKHIHKFAGAGAGISPGQHGDFKNVLKLVLEAKRRSADVLAFVRDVDNEDARGDAVLGGLAKAKSDAKLPGGIVGGVARPVLEGWMLALLGRHNTDELRKAAALREMAERGYAKQAAAYVEIVDASDISRIPAGAQSLHDWLGDARSVFAPLDGER